MYKPSKKTIYLTGAFAAVAGLVGVYSPTGMISPMLCATRFTQKQMKGRFD